MGKVLMAMVLGCALGVGTVAANSELRPFENTDGKVIEARLVDYNPDKDQVQLELKNGKKGWMPLSSLSQEDRAFVNVWRSRSDFLSGKKLSISIREEDSGWEHDGDGRRDRKTRSSRYHFTLVNQGETALKNIRVTYCLYREKVGGIGVDHHDQELPAIPPGHTVEERGKSRHGSFKVSSENWKNNVVGARFRLYWTAPDGAELYREHTVPDNLSDKEFAWREPEVEVDPSERGVKKGVDLTPKNLKEKDIEALAEAYATAMEERDYAVWRALLEPLHYGDPNLKEGVFTRYNVSSVSIKKVDGLNVYVQMRYKGGNKQLGWLQFSPSGHLKYTPLLFKHPVADAMRYFYTFYNTDPNGSGYGVRAFQSSKIPLFGFSSATNQQAKQDAIERIYAWLEKKGPTHDLGEPTLAIPEDQFGEMMEAAKIKIHEERFYSTN